MSFKNYIKENDEKTKHHFNRLDKHITLVQKYGKLISDLNLKEIDKKEFINDIKNHDKSKKSEPELKAYIDISWYYKLKKDGVDMPMTKDMETKMDMATKHHVKNNKHHPDYWSEDISTDGSMKNRGAVVKSAIDCTKMPNTHIAHMVADWLAMGEELGNKAKEWADKTVNKRWKFSDDQTNFIYKLINKIEA